MGIPSHSLDGFPDGIGRTGADGVSVGGTRVLVGVLVGSGVLVEVGKLVSVGVGVSVGLGAKVLQDANAMTSTESNIALPMVFIFFLTLCFDDLTSTQRLALADFGRAEILFEMWKKLEARKMLLEAADSQKSAARFVRRRFDNNLHFTLL